MKNITGFGCKNATRASSKFLISVKDDLNFIQWRDDNCRREQIIAEERDYVVSWIPARVGILLVLNNTDPCLSRSLLCIFCSPLNSCAQCSGVLSSLNELEVWRVKEVPSRHFSIDFRGLLIRLDDVTSGVITKNKELVWAGMQLQKLIWMAWVEYNGSLLTERRGWDGNFCLYWTPSWCSSLVSHWLGLNVNHLSVAMVLIATVDPIAIHGICSNAHIVIEEERG